MIPVDVAQWPIGVVASIFVGVGDPFCANSV